VRRAWDLLAPLPLGRWLFSRLLGWLAPYTGSMGATVEQLTPGHVRVRLPDRRRVRNHLDSIHAVAIANVAELASGLAVTSALPPGVRGIPVSLLIDYVKKARGTLVAECTTAVPVVTADCEHVALVFVRDAAGDVVARGAVTWQLGPA
jgi:acyl-coenzyme A thioesterase PaaI-like protein